MSDELAPKRKKVEVVEVLSSDGDDDLVVVAGPQKSPAAGSRPIQRTTTMAPPHQQPKTTKPLEGRPFAILPGGRGLGAKQAGILENVAVTKLGVQLLTSCTGAKHASEMNLDPVFRVLLKRLEKCEKRQNNQGGGGDGTGSQTPPVLLVTGFTTVEDLSAFLSDAVKSYQPPAGNNPAGRQQRRVALQQSLAGQNVSNPSALSERLLQNASIVTCLLPSAISGLADQQHSSPTSVGGVINPSKWPTSVMTAMPRRAADMDGAPPSHFKKGKDAMKNEGGASSFPWMEHAKPLSDNSTSANTTPGKHDLTPPKPEGWIDSGSTGFTSVFFPRQGGQMVKGDQPAGLSTAAQHGTKDTDGPFLSPASNNSEPPSHACADPTVNQLVSSAPKPSINTTASSSEQSGGGGGSGPGSMEIQWRPPTSTEMPVSQQISPFLSEGQKRRAQWYAKAKPFAWQNAGSEKWHKEKEEKKKLNAHLLAELESLQKKYKSMGDQWRQFAYGKAVGVIRRIPFEITSVDQIKELREQDKGRHRGLGTKIVNKIHEILETGTSNKLKLLNANPEIQACEELTKIWGVGSSESRRFYQQGIRSVAHLRQNEADITFQVLKREQILGLRYFEDLQERIPRAEVELIEKYVREAMLRALGPKISADIDAVVCGSYRRGKSSSGDVDILFCDRTGKRFDGLLDAIMQELYKPLRAVKIDRDPETEYGTWNAPNGGGGGGGGFESMLGGGPAPKYYERQTDKFLLDTLHISRNSSVESQCSDTWFGVVQIPDCDDECNCPCAHRAPDDTIHPPSFTPSSSPASTLLSGAAQIFKNENDTRWDAKREDDERSNSAFKKEDLSDDEEYMTMFNASKEDIMLKYSQPHLSQEGDKKQHHQQHTPHGTAANPITLLDEAEEEALAALVDVPTLSQKHQQKASRATPSRQRPTNTTDHESSTSRTPAHKNTMDAIGRTPPKLSPGWVKAAQSKHFLDVDGGSEVDLFSAPGGGGGGVKKETTMVFVDEDEPSVMPHHNHTSLFEHKGKTYVSLGDDDEDCHVKSEDGSHDDDKKKMFFSGPSEVKVKAKDEDKKFYVSSHNQKMKLDRYASASAPEQLHYKRGKHYARRLDLKVYPNEVFPFALLYFTGDGYFNRSMRNHAHKTGWSLSDRALTPVIRVNREEVHQGAPVPCYSEEDIFNALGMPYTVPSMRSLS